MTLLRISPGMDELIPSLSFQAGFETAIDTIIPTQVLMEKYVIH